MMKRRFHVTLFALLAVCVLIAQEALDWSQAETIVPGIQMLKLERQSPRIMKISVARIDLKNQALYFQTTGRAPAAEWGKPMDGEPNLLVRTLRTPTRQFMTEARTAGHNMVLAVNTNGWSPWKAPWNQREACDLGLIISNCLIVSPVFPRGNWCFVEYKDGRIDLTEIKPDTDLSSIRTCASGFGPVLRDGNPIESSKTDIHPRTGFGLSKDSRYLFLITIDGRQKGYSEGATTEEVGRLLKDAGAWKALNMDGGGSTTLLTWNEAENKIIKWNHHRNDAERSVGCSLGICLSVKQ